MAYSRVHVGSSKPRLQVVFRGFWGPGLTTGASDGSAVIAAGLATTPTLAQQARPLPAQI
jgi:hypothetical protein